MNYSQPKSLVRHPYISANVLAILGTLSVFFPTPDIRFLIASIIINSLSLVLVIAILIREKEIIWWYQGWLSCYKEFEPILRKKSYDERRQEIRSEIEMNSILFR